MSAYLASADEFSFHAEATYDDSVLGGIKIEYTASMDVGLRRPDRMYAEIVGDQSARRFWYDGKQMSLVYGGASYYYAGGVFYKPASSGYVVVAAPVGTVVPILPPVNQTVYVNNTTYHYYSGTYYETTSAPASSSQTVAPGGGATPGVAQSKGGGASGGAAAEALPDPDPSTNYQVVAPPVGATIKDLPKGATETTVSGEKFYTYEGAYYKPFDSGSDVVYMVVEDPHA